MEMLLDIVNQNVQEALKSTQVQVNKNNEYEKAQKQINELIGALNKHQTKKTSNLN
jgi:predicted transcriptional regulator